MIIDLAKVYRNNLPESIHYGIAVLIKGNTVIQSWGDAGFSCFTRSIIKPIQAKVSLSFITEKINEKYIAIACASHTGTVEQLSTLKEFSTAYGIAEDSLKLGLLKNSSGHRLCSKFEHNCAGKHSLMTLAEHNLRGKGLNTEVWLHAHDYSSPESKIQQEIIHELQSLLNHTTPKEILCGIDGCGLPTFYLSLKEMASLFSNSLLDTDYKRIYTAMSRYHLLIGGPQQIDSLIMQARPEELVAKGGAEGLMMVLNLKSQECLIIKIIDGSLRAKNLITRHFLEQLKWLKTQEIELDNSIVNSQGLKIGHIAPSDM